jgi:hypothetical protein
MKKQGDGMGRRTLRTAALLGTIAAVAAPAAAQAKIVHYSGKSSTGIDSNLTVAFDAGVKGGKVTTVMNVDVDLADYSCQNGFETERSPLFLDQLPAPVDAKGRFELSTENLPPGYKDELWGAFTAPTAKKGKKGKKAAKPKKAAAPAFKGFFSSQFGYGPTRDTYNCIAVQDVVATPAR